MITIIAIIIGAGIIGGIAQSILVPTKKSYWKLHLPQSIILGITAAAIVPLFLEMISSDLLKQKDDEYYSLLVFGSLCIVMAVFSRRFISSVGDKILSEVEEVKREANKAIEEANEAKEDVYEMASRIAEPEDEGELKELEAKVDEEFKEQVQTDLNETIKGLYKSEYNYRTANGLSKETGVGKILTETLLGTMQNFGLVKKIEYEDRPTLWGLTSRGKTFAKKKLHEDS